MTQVPSTCVGNHLGNTCPLCSAPAWVKDLQPNRQLTNVVHLCKKLRKVVEGKYVQKLESQTNGENFNTDFFFLLREIDSQVEECVPTVQSESPLVISNLLDKENETERPDKRQGRGASKGGDDDDDDDDDDDENDEDFDPCPEKKKTLSKRQKVKEKCVMVLKSNKRNIETKFSPKNSILRYTVNLRGRKMKGSQQMTDKRGRRIGIRRNNADSTSSDENKQNNGDNPVDVFDFVASPHRPKQTKRQKQSKSKPMLKKKIATYNKQWNLRKKSTRTTSHLEEDSAPARIGQSVSVSDADAGVSRQQDDGDSVHENGRGSRVSRRKKLEASEKGKTEKHSRDMDKEDSMTRNKDGDIERRVTRKRRSADKEEKEEQVKTRKVKVTEDRAVKMTRSKSIHDTKTPIKKLTSSTGRKSLSSPKVHCSPIVSGPSTPNATRSPSGQQNSPYGSLNKRNHKGETLLHKATVKGNIETVKTLLDAGADPNTKDYAGWTPLQEACNYGYVEMVTLLLNNGAFINTPGFENNSALHDAVSNYKIDIVKLLVQRGASLNVRNNHGLTPQDLACNDAMKEALNTEPLVQPTPHDNSPKFDPEIKRQITDIVVIGTGLKREQRVKLEQFAKLLNGRVVEEFDGSVTHVVTVCNDDGQCPRTMKFLQGVLNGKWIISYEWVKTCIEKKKHEEEQYFEVTGTTIHPFTLGPRKARLNYDQQFPGLFNGCHFYFHGNFSASAPTKAEFADLVKAGDGVVLTREPKSADCNQPGSVVPYHSQANVPQTECTHYIVYDQFTKNPPTKIQSPKLCTVSSLWLMSCISQFALLEQLE
ncbi:uncharacterized protein LOC144434269 [Glandiceps talaboti]